MWHPFDKPLDEVTSEDLLRLIDDEIEEQLYLEYKSEWAPRQIAKTVDAFANTEGGTLVVGMRTEGRRPVELVGITHAGDLGESLDQLVRSSITPRPEVRFSEVPNEGGRPSLVVEVPAGPARPYLVTSTGQVMRRTQTGTEAASRDFLDRLFLQGRAGERWARSVAAEAIADQTSAVTVARLWTVPAMDGGLSVSLALFRQATWQTMLQLATSNRWTSAFGDQRSRREITGESLRVIVPSFTESETFDIQGYTSGVIKSAWAEPEGSPIMLDTMIEDALPMHKTILTEVFGFHGDVVVALRNGWVVKQSDGGQRAHDISVVHPSLVLADDLADPDLGASLKREATRSRGYWAAEDD